MSRHGRGVSSRPQSETPARVCRKKGGPAALGILVGLLLAPADLLACPACAAREGPGVGVLALVGALIAVPYLIAAVTVKVVRRLERDG